MSSNMKKLPVIKNIKQIGQSRLFTIEQLDLEFSNGEQAVFERIKANAGKAVMVAAITAQNEILLVKEYAAGTENYELQLPKGIVEPGEQSEQAANRELAEETGYAASILQKIQTLRVSPGYFDHQTDLVLATELYEHQLDTGDEPEELEVVKYPLAEIDSLLQREDFSESRSIAGVLLVLRQLG
ncbi:MAG: ADP compounds hydrolase NudE [Gammaproteobacteria bacterium]|nr:ADP compounds hydrolase NudE [Gammaproteobacteria bacterium]